MTGNVWFDQTDVAIPGVGPAIVLVRSYNSRLALSNVGGAFGRGWAHGYEQNLTFQAPDIIKLRSANGSPIWFEDFNGDLTFNAMLPQAETSWIVKSGSSYVRSFREGGSETYDSVGRLLSQTDPSGNVSLLTYDLAGRLTTIVDPSTRTLSLSYDASGHIASASGPAGVIASYGYTSSGYLESVLYPDGSGFTFASDGAAQILSVSDLTGRIVEAHTYDTAGRGITSSLADGQQKYTLYYDTQDTLVADANGNVTDYDWVAIQGITQRVTRITGACASCAGGGAGEKQSWTYDNKGRVLSQTDGLGRTTTYTYDSSGNLSSETDPLNNTTTYTYDSQGRVLTINRPDGGLTTSTYGPAGPLTVTEKVTASQNRTTTIAYTGQGRLQTITDPRGKATTLGYNSFGDITSATDALNHATSFGYDELARRTTVTDPLNHTTTTTYDARGRVTMVTSPDATHTDFAYDAGGRRSSVTDPLGRQTIYNYDAYGRLQSVVDPLGGLTSYSYDAMSNLITLTDSLGRSTTFGYDTFNRVSSVTYPGGPVETFSYSGAGRLASKRDRKGVTTTYGYDNAGRLTGKSYSDGTPAVSYTYDTVGHPLTTANGTDTLSWTYDLAGELLSEQSSKNGSTVAYTYDLGGNRLSLSLNGSLFVGYTYDDTNRLTTITKGTSSFGFGYDNANRRTSMTYPNGIITTYGYDNLNRLTTLAANLGATPVTSFTYAYDTAGNRTSKTQLDYTETYTYDSLYRLTGADRTGGSTGRYHFDYDAVGNRLTKQLDGDVATSTYNNLNQLVSSSGGGTLRVRGVLDEPGTAKVNGQDARMLAGNTFEATIAATTGTNTFNVQATDVSGNSITKNYQVTVTGSGATYQYDPNGNLTQKVDGGVTTTYTWDAENKLTQVQNNGSTVASFSYDALGRRVQKVAGGVTTTWTYDGAAILRQVSGASTLKYIHGSGIDEPLASDDGTALSYFHADGLGSITKTTSAAGVVTLPRQNDAWGNLQAGGTTAGYAFTGREWDSETGLYYYRARYYDPKLGRFVSEDPIRFRGGVNFYAYVDNNPSNATDPSGLVIKRCFRSLRGGGTSLIALFFPVAFLVQPPVPGVNFCPMHEYIYNTATGSSKGHGPGQEPPETGKDICYEIPEPVGQCVWNNWNPGPYSLFTNNCEEAVNNAVKQCRACK